jgi:hypothetical protein
MFPNQIEFGKQIAAAFMLPGIYSILAVALTQSGKTGSMFSAIKQVPHDHAFIITGLSSVDWMEQTRARFPPKYRDSIFHRNQLHHFAKRVKDLTNVLIIIDENQIAFKERQTIHNTFVAAQIMELHDLKRKNVRIVHFTATPNNTSDFMESSFSKVVQMKQDNSYVSAFDLLNQGRILEYKDLCGALQDEDYSKLDWKHPTPYDVDPAVFDRIRELDPFLTHDPKYHIIRTSHSCFHDLTILNFRQVFKDAEFLSETDFDVILDQILLVKPSKHTFIFIKEKLRCAKTLHKDFLGVLYERFTKKPKMDTILQGLVGRLTGYHKNSNSVVFSNPQLVRDYQSQWEHIFQDQALDQKTIFIGRGSSF